MFCKWCDLRGLYILVMAFLGGISMIRLVPKSMLNLYLWTYFLILSLYGMGVGVSSSGVLVGCCIRIFNLRSVASRSAYSRDCLSSANQLPAPPWCKKTPSFSSHARNLLQPLSDALSSHVGPPSPASASRSGSWHHRGHRQARQ
jgi:hypothetical protein